MKTSRWHYTLIGFLVVLVAWNAWTYVVQGRPIALTLLVVNSSTLSFCLWAFIENFRVTNDELRRLERQIDEIVEAMERDMVRLTLAPVRLPTPCPGRLTPR